MISGDASWILYEDHYCRELHPLIKALRRETTDLPWICEAGTVNGVTNFPREVPRFLRLAFKQTKRPAERLVCVADADRPQMLFPTAPDPPKEPAVLESWVLELEQGWKEHLVQKCNLSREDTRRLRTIVLRWNKESLLVACPDALLDHGDRFGQRREVESVLEKCRPSLATLPDADFLHHFRRPKECLDRVIQAISSRKHKKGADDEDILRTQIRTNPARRAQVAARCPDLVRLVSALA